KHDRHLVPSLFRSKEAVGLKSGKDGTTLRFCAETSIFGVSHVPVLLTAVVGRGRPDPKLHHADACRGKAGLALLIRPGYPQPLLVGGWARSRGFGRSRFRASR